MWGVYSVGGLRHLEFSKTQKRSCETSAMNKVNKFCQPLAHFFHVRSDSPSTHKKLFSPDEQEASQDHDLSKRYTKYHRQETTYCYQDPQPDQETLR